jgi:hypothetical protein
MIDDELSVSFGHPIAGKPSIKLPPSTECRAISQAGDVNPDFHRTLHRPALAEDGFPASFESRISQLAPQVQSSISIEIPSSCEAGNVFPIPYWVTN